MNFIIYKYAASGYNLVYKPNLCEIQNVAHEWPLSVVVIATGFSWNEVSV